MLRTKQKLLFENKIDIKIKKWSKNNFFLNFLSFKDILLDLINPNSNSILVLRYLRINSFFKGISRYLIFIIFCKLFKKKLYWIMHNYYEHKSKSLLANKIIRSLILKYSTGLFVVHDEMKKFINFKYHDKISTIPFGLMNDELKKKYLEFDEEMLYHSHYDIICLTSSEDYFLREIYSTAKINSKMNFLIINPGSKSKFSTSLNNVNFISSYGFLDIKKHKKKFKKAVGFLPHKNNSFPTSLNFFIENLVPTISVQNNFASYVVNEYDLGISITSFSDLPISVLQIQKKYSFYVVNCRLYKNQLNWNIGANVLKNKL